MKTQFLLFVNIISFCILTGCKKNPTAGPCDFLIQPPEKFVIKEIVGDTAFITDTVFRDNYIQFESRGTYESVAWKIGTDTRTWQDSVFTLGFNNYLGTLPVRFEGH